MPQPIARAVKEVAQSCDAFLSGAPNSSNSNRLLEFAVRAGATHAHLVERGHDLPWGALQNAETLGISAGASARTWLKK